ncbi:hybrid sensor histidine kinase/response regulator [Paracidovorax wautersii]|uniref:ATP-binding response regulator n=1 Tax=Paracidovorax wautersii TaxID=1177982 RepID=UPI0031DB751B
MTMAANKAGIMNGAGDSAPASLEQRVLREQVATAYGSHIASISAHLGFSAVLALFGWTLMEPWLHPAVLVWFAVLLVVDLYALMARRWTPAVPMADDARWARKYTVLQTLASASTVPACFILTAMNSPEVTTVTTVVIMGGWTRAVQERWAIKPALFGYGIPMMSGLIIALALEGGVTHWLLAALITVNLVLTLRSGVQQNRRLTESLRLRFENEALAASLQEQIAISERASAEKTRFLAAASHDLRQPMHAVTLFGAALQGALAGHPARDNVDRMMRSVEALGASLDTMLDISRLDAGVVGVEERPVELSGLFSALHQTFAGMAEEKGLQLRLRSRGLWVRSDMQLLYRMLLNLIDNGLKYTQQGGVSVVARQVGQSVQIDVTDTGIGIATEQCGRIFEEFYQVDNPGRDRARGLGIGLSIVQRLAQLLKHPVSLRSRPGRGTRLRIHLPVAEPMDCPVGAALAQTEDDADCMHDLRHPLRQGALALPGRVLLIDDEADIRAAMAELLGSYGIEAVAVPGEAEAAELLEGGTTGRPFVVLMCDYRLADGTDGLEAGLRLCERFLTPQSLLLITGETSPERLLRARASGVPILFKPVVPATLLRAIVQVAQGKGTAASGGSDASAYCMNQPWLTTSD